MSKHTPGPWNLSRSGFGVIGGNEQGSHTICWTATNAKERCDSQNAANARLIAAAPDLLDALKALLHETMYKDHPGASDLAIAAIAKAEGK